MEREQPQELPCDESSLNSNYDAALANSLSNSLNSLNIFDRINNEAVFMGTRTEGRMPIVRRNFCLIVLFDFLLVSFIWLILEMLTGNGNLIQVFNDKIVHYTMEGSLFDIVMAAASRFTVLQLFYGLLQLETKFFVALTTAGTCVFLICKVIYYNWNASNQTAIQCLSLLVSFILCWIEVWFLDMRVIPQEQQARDIVASADLIRSESQRIVREHRVTINETLRRSALSSHHFSHPGSNFYTPLDSGSSSDDDGHRDDPDEREWLQLSKKVVKDVKVILNSTNWHRVVQDEQSSVLHTSLPNGMCCYKVQSLIKGSRDDLHRKMFDDVDDFAGWNPTIAECSRIMALNSSCDLLYQVTVKSFAVSQRDMVILRKSCSLGNQKIIAYTSTSHDSFPERRGVVRATFGPSCWVFQDSTTERGICEVIGIMNCDLKLKLPKAVLKKQIGKSLLEVIEGIRNINTKSHAFSE